MSTPELRKAFTGVSALPTSFIVSRESRVMMRHVGMLTAATTERETRHLAGLPVNASVEEIEKDKPPNSRMPAFGDVDLRHRFVENVEERRLAATREAERPSRARADAIETSRDAESMTQRVRSACPRRKNSSPRSTSRSSRVLKKVTRNGSTPVIRSYYDPPDTWKGAYQCEGMIRRHEAMFSYITQSRASGRSSAAADSPA